MSLQNSPFEPYRATAARTNAFPGTDFSLARQVGARLERGPHRRKGMAVMPLRASAPTAATRVVARVLAAAPPKPATGKTRICDLQSGIAAFTQRRAQSDRRTIPERAAGPTGASFPAHGGPAPGTHPAVVATDQDCLHVVNRYGRARDWAAQPPARQLPAAAIGGAGRRVGGGRERANVACAPRRAPEPSGSERQSRSPSRVREPSRGSGAAGGGRRALSRAGAGGRMGS